MKPQELKARIKALGTQSQFADTIGYTREHVSDWCRGAATIPKHIPYTLAGVELAAQQESSLSDQNLTPEHTSAAQSILTPEQIDTIQTEAREKYKALKNEIEALDDGDWYWASYVEASEAIHDRTGIARAVLLMTQPDKHRSRRQIYTREIRLQVAKVVDARSGKDDALAVADLLEMFPGLAGIHEGALLKVVDELEDRYSRIVNQVERE